MIFWLIWDDVIKVRNLPNNSKNIDFETVVFYQMIICIKFLFLLVYCMMRFKKVNFDWPTLWCHNNVVCQIHKTTVHSVVSQFFESLMSEYSIKQGIENAGQNAWWFPKWTPLPDLTTSQLDVNTSKNTSLKNKYHKNYICITQL